VYAQSAWEAELAARQRAHEKMFSHEQVQTETNVVEIKKVGVEF
jgi:hypothetical protein